MAITLIVEDGTGKSTANTYQNVAAVTARLALTPWASAWTTAAATTDLQEQLCIEATAMIDRLLWDGAKANDAQALAWPRAWMATPDGYAIASTSLPAWLLDGHARLCNWLAGKTSTPFASNGLQPGTELELPGGMRLTPASNPNALPPDVAQLFGPYIRGRGSLVRG